MENCESPNRWDCPIYNLKCISGVSELFTDKCSHCWFMGSSRYVLTSPFAWCIPPSGVMMYILGLQREVVRVLTAESKRCLLLSLWVLVHSWWHGLNLLAQHFEWRMRHFFPDGSLSHTTEGCAELSCSRLNLMVTGEGHILVDTKKTSPLMVTGQVCLFKSH